MSEVLPIQAYPVRPLPKPSESLAGYCWRVYASNGHKPDQFVIQILRVTGNDTNPEHIPTESALIGKVAAASMRAKELSLLTGRSQGTQPSWCCRAIAHRFCPLCIEQHGFHTVLWDMPLVLACPVHECRLVDRCDECGSTLMWHQMRIGFGCKCQCPVEEIATIPATRLETWLSRCVAYSADFEELMTMIGQGARCPNDWPRYKAWEFYEVVDWANRARNALTYDRRHRTYWDGTAAAPARAQKRPGAAVLRFVAGLPDSARRGTQRLLRRTFSANRSVLVDPLADPALQRLRRMVADMRQDTNLLARLVASTVDEVVRGHHASLASLPQVIYNPSLSSRRRVDFEARLRSWWSQLCVRLRSVEGSLSLPSNDGTACLPGWDLVDVPRRLLDVLNLVADLAQAGVPPDALTRLTARWQAPASAFIVHAGLDEIAATMASLHPAELIFAGELIRSDFNAWCGAQQPTGAPQSST